MKGGLQNLRVIGIIAMAWLSVGAGPLRDKGKPFLTYPMPPKPTPVDPLRMIPAVQVPEEPEKFIWKLVLPKFAAGAKEVPVFRFDERLKPIKVGSLPLGTIVKLDTFMAHGKNHYYAVPWQKSTGWINGVFIAPSGFAAPGQ